MEEERHVLSCKDMFSRLREGCVGVEVQRVRRAQGTPIKLV